MCSSEQFHGKSETTLESIWNSRRTLQEGDISHSNAKKLLELRKAKAPMPPWFKGLLLVEVKDPSRIGPQAVSYTLVATRKMTFWGVVE